MFDYTSIVLESDWRADFVQIHPNVFLGIDRTTGLSIGKVTLNGVTIDAETDEALIQYKLWSTRPERAVGKQAAIDGVNMEELIETYEEILVGAYILSAKQVNSEVTTLTLLPNIKSTLTWLRSTDFYTAPASTAFHESFPGGLLVHSLRVYNQAMKLRAIDSFADIPIEDAAIAALVHDWCKISLYESYQRNVKNEVSGEWEKVTSYRRAPKGLLLGHGVTSMYLANRCFNLKPEVALAIRWHMGHYDVSTRDEFELYESTDTYPLLLLIQFADQLSVTKYAK